MFQKREEFIKIGDDAMASGNTDDSLSAFLSAGIESVHLNWYRDIGYKIISILEIDFYYDKCQKILVGTESGQLIAFNSIGEDENIFISSSNNTNSLTFSTSVNSIVIAKDPVNKKEIVIVGADKLYVFEYKDGSLLVSNEIALDDNTPISRLEVFCFENEQRIVVGDINGNVYLYRMDGINISRILDFAFTAQARIIDIAIGDVNRDEEVEIVIASEDKHVYFLNPNGEKKADPFAVTHWITNIDVDKKTERLYIGEFDGNVHIYKYQKELIKKFFALKQHGILDLVVFRLFGDNGEPQFIIGTSDTTLSIFDSIDYDSNLLWSFTTGAGQRVVSASTIDKGIISLYVGTESCKLFKYTLCVDRLLKEKIRDVAVKKTFDQWLDLQFSRKQKDVLFKFIDNDPIVKIANYKTLTETSNKKNEIKKYHKAAMEMWWNGIEYRWSHNADGRVYAISVMNNVDSHTVLVASQNKCLLGLNYDDGSKEWTHSCSGGVRGVCAGHFFKDINNSFIAIATINNPKDCGFDKMYDNSIEVFDSNRNPIWSFNNKNWSLFVVADDVNNDGDYEIFVGTEDKKVLAFTNNGVLKWEAVAKERIRAVTIADLEGNGTKTVIVGSDDKYVYLFREDGNLLNSFLTPHFVLVVKAFDINNDGKCEIITGNEDGFIHVYDYEGNLIWQFETGSWIAALDICVNPKTHEVEIVIGSADKSIYGINQYGMLLWQYETDARVRALSVVNNEENNFDIIFGSYSDKDDVYKLTRIDQKKLYEQMQKMYFQYSNRITEIEKKLLNGEYESRHTRAFLYLFSENENILRNGADDNSDNVISAVGCAILRHFFPKGMMLDAIEKFLLSDNRKVRTTLLCEMERLISTGNLEARQCYLFLISILKYETRKKQMVRLIQIDIARFGYMFSANSEQLVMIANEIFPLSDKIIIDELHYVIWLLNHNEKFNMKELSNNNNIKIIFKKWIEYLSHYPEYKNDVEKMEAVCNA